MRPILWAVHTSPFGCPTYHHEIKHPGYISEELLEASSERTILCSVGFEKESHWLQEFIKGHCACPLAFYLMQNKRPARTINYITARMSLMSWQSTYVVCRSRQYSSAGSLRRCKWCSSNKDSLHSISWPIVSGTFPLTDISRIESFLGFRV